jgi:hypothetical protein
MNSKTKPSRAPLDLSKGNLWRIAFDATNGAALSADDRKVIWQVLADHAMPAGKPGNKPKDKTRLYALHWFWDTYFPSPANRDMRGTRQKDLASALGIKLPPRRQAQRDTETAVRGRLAALTPPQRLRMYKMIRHALSRAARRRVQRLGVRIRQLAKSKKAAGSRPRKN